ncbi:MAG: glucose-6-phosphate isomerase [Microbacteriaceae bacterium]|nr:glucose-6-phosphate isomerase [Microbacteriaceae bacterium]
MIHVSVAGCAADAADRLVPGLVADNVATRLDGGDATLWGENARAEASIRLGWVHAASHSHELVTEIEELRDEFRARGLNRIVLCGMGGSSLAPEVITQTAGVALVVLDSTHPEQVSRVVDTDLEETVVVISSKSGSTVETDSHKRAFELAFTSRGIDPVSRIVVVTDPNSPLDQSARETGYRVFNADPTVGGRYSALTAFGLVPSGLAGVDIGELLDDARDVEAGLLADSPANPALILGAAMAGTQPRRDKLGIVSAKSSIVGIGDWIEQLVAESTGKNETGVLPVVLEPRAIDLRAPDLLTVNIVDDATPTEIDSVTVAGPLGAQLLLWEIATVVAGRLLDINPFDQPDVESAKVATRTFLEGTPLPPVPFGVDGLSELSAVGYEPQATTAVDAVRELLDQCEPAGYVSVHGYADRDAGSHLESLRDVFAIASGGRPTTFGWGPRFLHSTGQYHKGGPRQGVFIQILQRPTVDREVPGRPFTFGELMGAQARGDATVLSQHDRPVLTLTVTGKDALVSLIARLRTLGKIS